MNPKSTKKSKHVSIFDEKWEDQISTDSDTEEEEDYNKKEKHDDFIPPPPKLVRTTNHDLRNLFQDPNFRYKCFYD